MSRTLVPVRGWVGILSRDVRLLEQSKHHILGMYNPLQHHFSPPVPPFSKSVLAFSHYTARQSDVQIGYEKATSRG